MPVSWHPAPGFTPLEIDNSAYYKVLMNGRFQNQRIMNVLWYRVGLDIVPGDFNLYGSEHLANCVLNNVWLAGMRTACSATYTLEDITVIPFNGTFDPVYNLPFILEVNQNGTQTFEAFSPAACITARFVLEAQILGINGWFPPRRGYVSFGPIREVDLTPDGRLTPAAETFYETNLNPFAVDLSLLPHPITYFPIRVRVTNVLGVLNLLGWTDIFSLDVRPIATFRRSRLPEA